jgi:uncharacterized protein (TIRG00374 family)
LARSRRSLILLVIGIALFLVYLALSNPFAAFAESHFDAPTYLLAIVIDYVGLIAFTASWYTIVALLDIGIGPIEAIQVMFTSMFVGWLAPIPLNTEIVRAYLIRGKKNSNMAKAVASVLVHRAFYNLAFGAIIGFTTFLVFLNHGAVPIQREVVEFLLMFALISAAVFSLVLNPKILKAVYKLSPGWVRRNIIDRLVGGGTSSEGFDGFVTDLESVHTSMRIRWGMCVISFVLVALHWALGAVTTYIVALSMGVHLELWVVIFIYAVIEFIQQLNWFIPSGLGIVDAGLTGAFVITGVPLSLAAALSLLTRFATNWVEIILYAPVTIGYGYKELLKDYPGAE